MFTASALLLTAPLIRHPDSACRVIKPLTKLHVLQVSGLLAPKKWTHKTPISLSLTFFA